MIESNLNPCAPAFSRRVAVLFDIDGTLLDLRGAGRAAFVRTLATVFGWRDDIAYINFAGNTDLNVLQQIFARRGARLTSAARRSFFAALPVELERRVAGAELIRHPGAAELLARLAADERVALGLVTGNIEACARIKLRTADVLRYVARGAFGDEHADRGDIARLALRRVAASLAPGERLAGVFLIGDTPYDIAAARAIGATSLAVATGKFDVAALRAAGADHGLADLADTTAALHILGLA
ncbi:MAG: haloacid dehalogenase-like hydrolase [Kiritimatiellaeota bacterium]|nr:haloacid dehalogenase-like hydrolase [Kiritimatiellota bacterium]